MSFGRFPLLVTGVMNVITAARALIYVKGHRSAHTSTLAPRWNRQTRCIDVDDDFAIAEQVGVRITRAERTQLCPPSLAASCQPGPRPALSSYDFHWAGEVAFGRLGATCCWDTATESEI